MVFVLFPDEDVIEFGYFSMCGIAGFAGQNRDTIERMTHAIAHRGPDNHATEVLDGASIGNRRLAILDPRPEGNQPMWNDDHTVVITYNGEIFNYRELREQEKFQCKTNTDTEVILKLYERYGMDFLPRLNGEFAFGLWDMKTRTWNLARDAAGILPLFVAYPGGKLHFASEMRALLLSLSQKPQLNMRALSQYLRLQYVPGPETLCEGIESLSPGTVLQWCEGKEKRHTFMPKVDAVSFASQSDFRERFPRMMDEAVKSHMIADKPVGLFLSGGMDSSIVLHHMSAHAAKPLHTFTVRFEATEQEGAKRFNTDADLAAMTAKHYGTAHEELHMTAAMCRDAYRDTARALDQPNADSVAMAQFLLARQAKQHVDVVLCGAGGDELFGGYPRYRIAHVLQSMRMVPSSLRALAGKLTGHPSDVLAMSPGPALAERLLARPSTEISDVVRGSWFDADATTKLFSDRWHKKAGTRNAERANDPIRDFMEFDRGLWLVDESLRLADAVTLGGNGLECRIPFLDPQIIAAAHATPSNWHVTLGHTKTLLKNTYRSILPNHLFTLAKASFYPPLAKWIRREAGSLVEEALENKRMQELFDVEKVRTLHQDHKNGAYHLHTLSTLTQLSYWFEEVYDAPTPKHS